MRWAAAVVACASLLAACGAGDDERYFGTTKRVGKDEATFYTNLGGEPEYLDPGKMSDTASAALGLQLFEGLTKYDPRDGHPTQGVATHWDKSDDNRFFRFHLRPNAKWSDGKRVTAEDFAYAWRRVLDPKGGSRAAPHLYALKNGELYNRGRLLVLKRAAPLREGAAGGAPAAARLAKGDAVRVLARFPLQVATDIVPFAAPPDAKLLVRRKADAKTGAPEQVTYEGLAKPIVAAQATSWRGAVVEGAGVVGHVSCDGELDRWYEVSGPRGHGYLPGCMLQPSKSGKPYMLVERFNGSPTYDPAKAPEPPSTARGFVDAADLESDPSVLGVRAVDDDTLDVELEHPTPYFIDLTSNTALYPVRRDVIEDFERRGTPDLWTRPENIVSNGPFSLETWKFRYEITLKANPFYWNAAALRLRRIVWYEVEEYHATLNLYRAGDIDHIGDNVSLPSDLQPMLRTKKDYSNGPILAVYWFELNTRKPPLGDVRVRRALSLAIDKQAIVDHVTRGGQIPATHFVPDITGLGYADAVARERAHGGDRFAAKDLAFDPARARALLAEAGFPVTGDAPNRHAEGMPPIDVLYNTSEGHRQIAVAIQSMWKANLGVDVTLRNEEWRVMLKSFRDGNYQVLRWGQVAEYDHPNTFLEPFVSGTPQNTTGWGSAAFDEALERAAREPDRAASMRLYRDAEAIAVDAMPRIPLYFYTKSTLVKPWVRGYYPSPRNLHLLEYMWIDPAAARGSAAEGQAPEGLAFLPLEPPPPGRLGPPEAEEAPL